MKNAKINKVVKRCLILAAVVMTGSFCFHSDIIWRGEGGFHKEYYRVYAGSQKELQYKKQG